MQTLIECTARRDLRHRTLWLVCALYLAIVLAIIYPLGIFSGPTGPQRIFQALQLLHFAIAVLVPAWVAGRLVEDRVSGMLELMKVAGLAPGQWIGFRLFHIAATYGSIWVLRLPLYSLVMATRGATMADILWAEVICAGVMLAHAQISLFLARGCRLERTVTTVSIVLTILGNALFFLPSYAVQIATARQYAVPESIRDSATILRELSLLNYVLSRPTTPEGQWKAAAALAIPLMLGVAATFFLRRTLYVDPATGPGNVAGTRPSRRVWDDALAWQAAEYHCVPQKKKRVIAWTIVVAMVCLTFLPSLSESMQYAVSVVMIFAFAAPGMAPATCSSLERLHNTISSLALLPLGGKAIYDGWKRGGAVRRAEGWIAAGLIFLGLMWNDPLAGMGWALAAVVAAYALPPIFFLESLRELSNGRGVLRSMVGMGIYWSIQLVGVLPVGIVTSVAAILYRPRAIRMMDELFDEASAR
ncbi:hypothetical protein Pan44_11310 [Caulifigura coniformis]|uniref:Uncharacterized protein n=1 Tax=Caulifigura coniformis TaxID=2527983 RepID=A0A517SAK8_9PLAN|nr:hypothetical protein [Caulifigura coniformis]QDT53116.1 hypothetical protein Pan44_11310 [Caulifigura coniformis]